MIQFILGAVVGACLSVAFERLYRKLHEDLYRLKGDDSFLWDRNGLGVQLMIQNVGESDVPDFDVVLRDDKYTIKMFQTESEGKMLPKQKRQYTSVLVPTESPERWKEALTKLFHTRLGENIDFFVAGMSLELQMKDSDEILHTSRPAGKALGRVVYRLIHSDDPKKAFGGPEQDFGFKPRPTLFERFLGKDQETIPSRSALKADMGTLPSGEKLEFEVHETKEGG